KMSVLVPLSAPMVSFCPATRAKSVVGLQADAKIVLLFIGDGMVLVSWPLKIRYLPHGPVISAEESSDFHVMLCRAVLLDSSGVGIAWTETLPLETVTFNRVLLSPTARAYAPSCLHLT